MARVNKIDSNLTESRYCQELTLGVLDPTPANQSWKPLEPNSYKDFGSKVTTVARNPINAGRQRKKGVVTDQEASGGIMTDLTQTNMQDLLQGFFFADLRKKTEETGFTATTSGTKKYTKATSAFLVGDLAFATLFTNATNNGLKRVTAVDATDVTVNETVVTEVPAATAKFVRVGFQFSASDAVIDVTGTLPALTTTTKNLTQLGLIPGEWVYIGGDLAAEKFATAADNGFARVRSVATNKIVFDKTAGTMVGDVGTAKTVRIFFGRVLKNEVGTLIKRRSYQFERKLGFNNDTDSTKEQADYLIGSIANEFSMNVPTAEKVTADLTFQSLYSSTIDENAPATLKSKVGGVLTPALVEADAFNTSSDVTRINLSVVSATNPNPTPLFAFIKEATISVNNNATPNKAVGVIGAFEVTVGDFEVGGKLTAYFADVASVNAVNNNSDISLDMHFVKANAGVSLDLPLLTLGDGRPNVEKDQAVTLPLDMMAATGAKVDPSLNHTALMVFWDYLPSAADS